MLLFFSLENERLSEKWIVKNEKCVENWGKWAKKAIYTEGSLFLKEIKN
jgi:hypothetical protein